MAGRSVSGGIALRFVFAGGAEGRDNTIDIIGQGEVVLFVEANDIGIGKEVFAGVVLVFFFLLGYLSGCGWRYAASRAGEAGWHKGGDTDLGARG